MCHFKRVFRLHNLLQINLSSCCSCSDQDILQGPLSLINTQASFFLIMCPDLPFLRSCTLENLQFVIFFSAPLRYKSYSQFRPGLQLRNAFLQDFRVLPLKYNQQGNGAYLSQSLWECRSLTLLNNNWQTQLA